MLKIILINLLIVTSLFAAKEGDISYASKAKWVVIKNINPILQKINGKKIFQSSARSCILSSASRIKIIGINKEKESYLVQIQDKKIKERYQRNWCLNHIVFYLDFIEWEDKEVALKKLDKGRIIPTLSKEESWIQSQIKKHL